MNVSANQPVFYLFGAVLHSRPPLLHLNHQVLKQPLLVLEGLPRMHHPEHTTHPRGSTCSLTQSLGRKRTRIKFYVPKDKAIMQTTSEAATVAKHPRKQNHMNA